MLEKYQTENFIMGTTIILVIAEIQIIAMKLTLKTLKL